MNEERAKQPFDVVQRARHYNSHPSKVETKEITNYLSFNIGNTFKYVMRRDMKEPLRSLQSAMWYLNEHLATPGVPPLLGSEESTSEVQKKLVLIQGTEQRVLDMVFYLAFRHYVFVPTSNNGLALIAALDALIRDQQEREAQPVDKPK